MRLLLENVECELLLGCQRIRAKRNADEQKGKEQSHEHCSPGERVVPPNLPNSFIRLDFFARRHH